MDEKNKIYNLINKDFINEKYYIKEIISIDKDNIKKSKIRVVCKNCNDESIKTINALLDTRRNCRCKTKQTIEIKTLKFNEKVFKKFNGNFIPLENFENQYKKIKIKCSKCNTEFIVVPKDFLRGEYSCPNRNCINNKTAESIRTKCKNKLLKDILNTDFECLNIEDFKNASLENLQFLHKKCGNILTMSYYNFYRRENKKCPYCYEKIKKNKIATANLERLKKLSNNEYYFNLEDFIDKRKKIEIFSKNTNLTFQTSLSYLFRKLRNKNNYIKCSSKGEEKIKEILIKNNISFESQKTFKNLKSKKRKPLFFDFYLPEYNILIEYDGEFHYFPILNKDILKEQKDNDRIKNNFSKENSIKLIRIPFINYNNLDEIIFNLIDRLRNKKIITNHKLKIETKIPDSTIKKYNNKKSICTSK